MENTILIDLQNVNKTFGVGKSKIRALEDVSLQIEEGDLISIMGPSGSGKSTLLYVIGAMDKPSSGLVLINGKNVANLPESKLSEHRKDFIGFVFQNYYLIPNLDVVGNILMPLIPYRAKAKGKQRALDLITFVGLEGREHSKVGKLSGGESQRVAIARALINDPKVILADEPTGNLDSESGKKIVEYLIQLAENGKTVIIVTHDPRIVRMVKDHPLGKNIWISDGKLINDPNFSVYEW